jgi:protein-S-isoprenylcysteine O-methyltransferase Ste14
MLESTLEEHDRCVWFLFRRCLFYSKLLPAVLAAGFMEKNPMPRALGPLLKTLLFTILVPGFVLVGAPYLLLGGFPAPGRGPLAWLGLLCVVIGASIYFRCAWEFAVRGLGTPAPIAPTKFLVVSGLHRYVRNPMYIGVMLVIWGEAALFHSAVLAVYAVMVCIPVHLFVIFYEEPTLRRQFGEQYEEYRRAVPRWIPRFKK